jgi:hypothetical protein
MTNSRRTAALSWIGIALLAGGALAACGDDDSAADTTIAEVPLATIAESSSPVAPTSIADTEASEGSSPASSQAAGDVCADSEALRESLGQVRSFEISRQRLTVLREDLAEVGDSLSALRSSAGAALRPAIDDLGASIDGLQEAIDGGGVGAVVSAVGDVIDSAQALLQQIADGPCPTISSSIPDVSIAGSTEP